MMQQVVRRLSSSTLFKRVFGGETSGRGRSYAAAASSDAQPTKRRKTRVSLDQRKAMLESYVNKYRAMNSGKFPSPSHAQKEVGGSYYVIKKFVEELEYQSRMSTTSRRGENSQQKDITEEGKSVDDPEVSSTKMKVHEKIHQDAPTKDGNLLVKEAATTLPDLERVSGSQITVDADTREDTRKGKKTLLRNKVCRENESTETEKLSIIQTILDADVQKVAEIQIDVQTSLGTEVANKIESSTEVEEMLSNQTQIDMGIHENAQTSAINNVDSDISKANDGLTSTCSEKSLLDEVARPSATQGDTSEAIKVKSHQLKEEAVDLNQSSDKAVDNVKEESASGDMLSDRLKSEAEQVHQAEKSETTRDLSKEHGDDTQPQRKSFMWENLKSLANGIVNIWRKL